MYRLVFLLFIVLYYSACNTTKSTTESASEVPTSVDPPPPLTAVIELTDDNFSDQMKKGEGLRMAYFTAEWCGPCRVVGPTVDKISVDYQDKVLMGKIDVDTNLVDAFNNITTVPTILFFKNGVEVYRTHGTVTEEYLTTVIDRLL